MTLFISILAFCAFSLSLILFFINVIEREFKIRDFIILLSAFILTICVVVFKDMATKCTDPCPKYEKVTESFYRLKE